MKVGARKHTTAAAGTEVLCTKRTSTATKVLLPIRLLLLSLRTSKPSKYVRHFIFTLARSSTTSVLQVMHHIFLRIGLLRHFMKVELR